MTERTTYDLFVKGDKYLNFDTEKGAREWLKEARAEGRLVGVDVDVRPRKSREYRIGEMWRDDFDYEGMVKAGSKADITWGPKTLRKLFDSFEDVNYHGPSSPLWTALGHLEKGETVEAKKDLDIFRLAKDLAIKIHKMSLNENANQLKRATIFLKAKAARLGMELTKESVS